MSNSTDPGCVGFLVFAVICAILMFVSIIAHGSEPRTLPKDKGPRREDDSSASYGYPDMGGKMGAQSNEWTPMYRHESGQTEAHEHDQKILEYAWQVAERLREREHQDPHFDANVEAGRWYKQNAGRVNSEGRHILREAMREGVKFYEYGAKKPNKWGL